MSVKFEKETVKAVEKTKDDLVHKVGEHLTGGKAAQAQKGYLTVRVFPIAVHVATTIWIRY